MLIPTTTDDLVGSLRVELTCENLIRVGREDLIADLLDLCHALLIIYLYEWQFTGDAEASSIRRIIDCMELIFRVQRNVLNRVALDGGPADDATIEAGAEEPLRIHRIIIGWSPCKTSDWQVHFIIFDFI